MEKVVLPNGLTVIFRPKAGKAVVVEVMVKVGSNQEQPGERGISHFLEHIVFEGTSKRPTNQEISNEIERIGGEFNAYTTNERTCFYVKVLQKHFQKAVEILADIIQHPLLRTVDIEKEKKVVLKEIDMVNDEPRFYQWLLLQRELFEKHPAKYPTYGDKKVIQALNREKINTYFKKYYVPNNIVISVVGEVTGWKEKIQEYFTFGVGKKVGVAAIIEPPAHKIQEKVEHRKTTNTYTVMGFKTIPLIHEDAPVLEVIQGILGRGQSGRMFAEIRSKRGLGYDVGTQNIGETTFGYFAIYASIDKKQIAVVKKLILQELKKLQDISAMEVREGQDFIEGNYYLELEEVQKTADQILFWEQAGEAQLMEGYIKNIKKVTVDDVRRVARKYFKYYTFVVVEGK